ncbi:MAG: glycoside hydrolase family 97 C-terminal domain-containing protein [Sphingomicrobium sp.]
MLRHILTSTALPCPAAPALGQPLIVASPDGRVSARVAIDAQNRPTYALSFRGRDVIAPSPFGLAFERYQTLSSGMAVQGSSSRSGADSYPLIGKASSVRDSPDNYRVQSGFDFVQSVPSAWDETRSISGALGEHVAIARRKGRDWYVGAMTNEQGRSVAIPLTFLGSGKWTANSWQDGSSSMEVLRSTVPVAAGDTLQLKLAPSGGGVLRLIPSR